MTYRIDACYGMCPNQTEGILNGKHFYFRARWDYWNLSIGDTEQEAINGKVIDGGYEKDAGWWDDEYHKKFVTELLDKHSKEEQ